MYNFLIKNNFKKTTTLYSYIFYGNIYSNGNGLVINMTRKITYVRFYLS